MTDNTDLCKRLRDLEYLHTNAVCPELREEAAAAIERLEADNAALRRFAGECLEPWPECLYDIDGEMQNRLHHAGLIEERIADHHGDDHEIGDTVFFLTDAGKAAIDAAIAKEKP